MSRPPCLVVPIVSTEVPSTIAATLTPKIPLTIAPPVIATSSTSEAATTSTKQTEDLIKSMEEMKIQATEIQKLKEMVTILEHNYEISQINYTEEERKIRRMTDRIKTLEK